MKKRNIAIFLIISILVILGIVKKIQNIYEFPYLYVISDDKKWKAYAYPAYEGGQWTGEMFFLGNKEGDVGKIQYSVKYNGKENYYNGEIKPTKYDIHNTETDEKIIKEKRNKVYELWEFAEFDENENNKIEIRVNWKLYMSFWLSFYIFLNVRKALFYRLYGHFAFVVNLTYLGLSSYIFSIKRG